MTDASSPDPASAPVPGQAPEIAIDITAFLPEGVELGDPTTDAVDAVAVDAVAVDAVAVEDPAPAVDLEALSQIERDLDAVDAAIAALDAGTYGIDPVTGQPIDDELLAENPTRLS